MDGSVPFSMHPWACFPSICSALRPNPQSPESHGPHLPYFLVPRFGQSFYAFLLDCFDQICGEFFFFLIWKQIVVEGEKRCCLNSSSVSLVVQVVKNLSATQKTQVQSLGQEDSLERAWQPTPVFLPGKSPWTEEPGGLQSLGSERV